MLDSGYTLEFTPSVPWTPGALIQWWTTGSLTDTTYNTSINGASGYFYVAASTSTLAPAVQVASPPNYTNPVPAQHHLRPAVQHAAESGDGHRK